jgi:hypothetical protein
MNLTRERKICLEHLNLLHEGRVKTQRVGRGLEGEQDRVEGLRGQEGY